MSMYLLSLKKKKAKKRLWVKSDVTNTQNLLCQDAELARLTGDWQHTIWQYWHWWSIHDLTSHLSNHYQTTGTASDRGINEEVRKRKIKTNLIKSWDRKGRERDQQTDWEKGMIHIQEYCRFVFVSYNNTQSFLQNSNHYYYTGVFAAHSWGRSATKLQYNVQCLMEVFTSSFERLQWVGRVFGVSWTETLLLDNGC